MPCCSQPDGRMNIFLKSRFFLIKKEIWLQVTLVKSKENKIKKKWEEYRVCNVTGLISYKGLLLCWMRSARSVASLLVCFFLFCFWIDDVVIGVFSYALSIFLVWLCHPWNIHIFLSRACVKIEISFCSVPRTVPTIHISCILFLNIVYAHVSFSWLAFLIAYHLSLGSCWVENKFSEWIPFFNNFLGSYPICVRICVRIRDAV